MMLLPHCPPRFIEKKCGWLLVAKWLEARVREGDLARLIGDSSPIVVFANEQLAYYLFASRGVPISTVRVYGDGQNFV